MRSRRTLKPDRTTNLFVNQRCGLYEDEITALFGPYKAKGVMTWRSPPPAQAPFEGLICYANIPFVNDKVTYEYTKKTCAQVNG